MVYYALGRKAESDSALATLIAKYEKDGPITLPMSMPSAAMPTRPSNGSTKRSI